MTAADLGADGAMAALLKDAMLPNLVQTLEGNPALVHGGPFANIAHGCNSVAATRLGLRLADVVVTEAGFGADLGGEKFCDIKCRLSGLEPAACVVVATVRALKMHGGVARAALDAPDVAAVRRGAANLRRHVENMHAFGHAVWATMGPENELFAEAMEGAGPLLAWCDKATSREHLAPDSLGMAMYEAADDGRITAEEAKLLVQVILSAGADTTVLTMANAIGAFARFPDQYERVRADPKMMRNAFDESLRWDSPSRWAGRIAMRDVAVEDYVIPAGTRTGLMFAAANRDPRFWDDPDAFDVGRDVRKHVGWGYGVHACVGRTLAQMEATALLGAFAREVEAIEIVGEVEPWMTTIGHGPARMPVRFRVA